MAGFADLAPAVGLVRVRGVDLEVRGLRLSDIAALIARFQGLAGALDGGDVVRAVMEEGEDAIAATIAAGARQPVDDVAAADLTAFEQAQLLRAIVELTLPAEDTELGNFLAAVRRLADRVELAAAGIGSGPGKSSPPEATTPAS